MISSRTPYGDRRRHQRIKVAVSGRMMLPDRTEHPCETVDMSPGGLLLKAPVGPYRGQKVIVYLADLGRVEGVATRILRDRFAISITSSARKREKTASSLTWLGNREELGLPENRRSERIMLARPFVTLRLDDGSQHSGRVLDVAMGGAAITTSIRLPVNSPVSVGRRAARIIRHFDDGVVVQFIMPISPDDLHSHLAGC